MDDYIDGMVCFVNVYMIVIYEEEELDFKEYC